MSRSSVSSGAWENFKQILAAVILAVVIKTSIVEAYKIPSQSMEDTLLVGDFLLANKFVYGARLPVVDWRLPGFGDPKAGDVVIFIFPRDGVTKYIKRCIGVPGDTVEVRDKQLFINSVPFENPEYSKYIDTVAGGDQRVHVRPPRDNFGPFVVPPDSYFMMGDNRDNSYDSRFWGVVRKEYVLGEAMMIHWSWDDSEYQSPDVSANDPLSVPRVFLYNTIHFFEKVRWSRLFSIIS
ncbi:MAG: signal peptidase I [bacterium]|nr:signal peptidase I [bacterium]